MIWLWRGTKLRAVAASTTRRAHCLASRFSVFRISLSRSKRLPWPRRADDCGCCTAGMSKAIDCVSGQVGAEVSRALAPHGELIVFGALSTHRQTDPDKLTIPIFARSLIYETKTVRGFWLFRWFTKTPKDRMAATIDRTLQLADSGALCVPEGQPIPVEKFGEAVDLAEAPAHGGKPLLVFEP